MTKIVFHRQSSLFLEKLLRYEVDENTFSKKGYFAYETQFWPLLSRMNEYGRPKVTFC